MEGGEAGYRPGERGGRAIEGNRFSCLLISLASAEPVMIDGNTGLGGRDSIEMKGDSIGARVVVEVEA